MKNKNKREDYFKNFNSNCSVSSSQKINIKNRNSRRKNIFTFSARTVNNDKEIMINSFSWVIEMILLKFWTEST